MKSSNFHFENGTFAVFSQRAPYVLRTCSARAPYVLRTCSDPLLPAEAKHVRLPAPGSGLRGLNQNCNGHIRSEVLFFLTRRRSVSSTWTNFFPIRAVKKSEMNRRMYHSAVFEPKQLRVKTLGDFLLSDLQKRFFSLGRVLVIMLPGTVLFAQTETHATVGRN